MKTLFKILLVCGISFGLVEAACRCIRSKQGSLWASAYRPAVYTDSLHLVLIQETSRGRRLTPNLQLLAKSPFSTTDNFILRTNSFGTRGPEPDRLRTKKRILFLGDSVTWSDYLQEEETFPVIIQRNFASKVEVINGAIGATGTDNYVSLLSELGPQLTPNLIVVGLYLNDSTPSPAYPQPLVPPPFNHSRYFELLAEQIGRYRYFRSAEYDRLVSDARPLGSDIESNFHAYDGTKRSECTAAFETAIVQAKLDWGLGWSDLAWQRIKGDLAKIKSWADNNNAQLAVVLLPVSYQLCNRDNPSYPSLKFEQLTKELGVAHIDLLPALQHQDSKTVYIDQCHFSSQGNQFVADELSNFFKNNNLI